MSAPLLLKLLVFGGTVGTTLALVSKAGGRRKRVGRVPNPFTDDTCMKLRSKDHAAKWVNSVGFRRYRDAFHADPITPEDSLELQVLKTNEYVAVALASLPLQCTPYNGVEARRELYKMLWCAVVGDLAGRNLIDVGPADVNEHCSDPEYNPIDYYG